MRIAIFVGTRADLGPLEPVVAAFVAGGHDTHLLTGVAFDAEALRARTAHIPGSTIHALVPPIESFDASTMSRQGAEILRTAGALFAELRFDAFVVLGDRWELLAVVPAAFLHDTRIVHIHGGEVTEGAIDERIRHAVTKLADVHCVASSDAARRVAQMGEPEERIFETGAPGLDRIVEAKPLDDDELRELVGRDFERPLALYTYHPPTATPDAPLADWVRSSLSATLQLCGTVIATDPGMDEGRDVILATLDDMAREDPRIVRISSLGARYPRALAAVDVVVGNSSSGVIEAASAGVPAVDIGTRQEGRLRASSVIHADDSASSVESALRNALGGDFDVARMRDGNPYGAGGAAMKIVDATSAAKTFGIKKSFVDRV